MQRTKHVPAGHWRTVEWFWNASGTAYFFMPDGGQIKVRYGVGWFGKDRQKQTLDGRTWKRLHVSSGYSLSRAQMQIRVAQSTEVTYQVFAAGEPITVPI